MSKRNTSLQAITAQIKQLERRTIDNVVEIGRLLAQACEQCDHGQYEDWLSENFSWSLSTALRYRKVYKLSEDPQIRHVGGFDRLNMTLSAVHLLAQYAPTDYPPNAPYAKAMIKAAQKGRVGYGDAQAIIEEVKAKIEAKRRSEEPPPVELLPDEIEPPKAEELPPLPELPPSDEVELVPPPSDTRYIDPKPPLVVTLRHMHGVAMRTAPADVQKAINEVGPVVVREIVNTLKAGLDEHSKKSRIKAKADAAEAAARPH
jgi:hypothetical protein